MSKEPNVGEHKRLLLIDDDPNLILLVKDYLEFRGYEVITAENGQEALDVLDLETPDMIICDVMMPQMDGNALAQSVKNDPKLKDLPIIMVTASKEVDLVKKSFSSGCVLFLPKPFTAASLLSLLQLVLK